MLIQSARTAQWTPPRRLLILLPALLMFLSACAGPSYYVQAASGHLELMRQRQDIGEILADGATDPDLARRLELARDIRVFAIADLALPESGSYTRYAATGREAASWNVVAAPEFSLEPKTWCFLVAGCVPYRGYFAREKAESFAGKMERRGFDVSVTPAVAYSTLGWFDDPVLDTMFAYSDARLAGVIFHEMAHQALYLKNDTAFNESFASFVEQAGVRRWLEHRGDRPAYTQWREQNERWREQNEIYLRHREELAGLYASTADESAMRAGKRRILGRLCRELGASPAPDGGGADGCGINNATLALHRSYAGGGCAFESLYREARGEMSRFHELAKQVSEMPASDRTAWLDQPCDPVAPEGNL